MQQPTEYPKFYRKEGKCVKVVSDTETRTIILPPDAKVPERYSTAFPSRTRLEETLAGLEEVPAEIFKNFTFTFYQQVHHEHQTITL